MDQGTRNETDHHKNTPNNTNQGTRKDEYIIPSRRMMDSQGQKVVRNQQAEQVRYTMRH